MATLATHVHAVGPDGVPVVLSPGEPVPAWAETAISNPAAWVEPPEPEPDPAEPEPEPEPAKGRSVKDAPRPADHQ